MIAVIDIIANNSYLAEMMRSIGDGADGMPLEISEFLANLSVTLPCRAKTVEHKAPRPF
jgi:hypothetical protein